MLYRIKEYRFRKFILQVQVNRRVNRYVFWAPKVPGWVPVNHKGDPCINGDHHPVFDRAEDAESFLNWVLSDKTIGSVLDTSVTAPIKDCTADGTAHEVFSTPATVVMEGVAIPATANFKVTHVNGEELESYKGDLLEVSVKDDGTAEVTDFIPREIAETDVVAKVAEREISKRGRKPKAQAVTPTEPKRRGRPRKIAPVEPRQVEPDTNLEGEIKLLFLQGFKLDEVQAMYPMVPMTDLVKLKSDARA